MTTMIANQLVNISSYLTMDQSVKTQRNKNISPYYPQKLNISVKNEVDGEDDRLLTSGLSSLCATATPNRG
jgi:hypothetical protein